MIITARFRDDALEPTDFRAILERIAPIVAVLREKNPELGQWYLSTDTKETSLLYEAYEDGQPGRAILAVLGEEFKSVGEPAHISLWDGNSNQKRGATLSVLMAFKGSPHSVVIRLYRAEELGDATSVVDVISVIARTLEPAFVAVAPKSYVVEKVFQDRPGVGWMLYLPCNLSTKEVPEAQALVPVKQEKRQIGTIIVTLKDEIFSVRERDTYRQPTGWKSVWSTRICCRYSHQCRVLELLFRLEPR